MQPDDGNDDVGQTDEVSCDGVGSDPGMVLVVGDIPKIVEPTLEFPVATIDSKDFGRAYFPDPREVMS